MHIIRVSLSYDQILEVRVSFSDSLCSYGNLMRHQNSLLSNAVNLAWDQWVPEPLQRSLGVAPPLKAIVQKLGLTKMTEIEKIQTPLSHLQQDRSRVRRRSLSREEEDATQAGIRKRPKLIASLPTAIKEEHTSERGSLCGDCAYPVEDQLPDFRASTSTVCSGSEQWLCMHGSQWSPAAPHYTVCGDTTTSPPLDPVLSGHNQPSRQPTQVTVKATNIGVMPLCLRRGQAQLFGREGCPTLDLSLLHSVPSRFTL